jgi:hypothetical protein
MSTFDEEIVVSGAKIGDGLKPGDDPLEALRVMAFEITQKALEGSQLAMRRVVVDGGKYASHHEDYPPIFREIFAMATNMHSVLKRELHNAQYDENGNYTGPDAVYIFERDGGS